MVGKVMTVRRSLIATMLAVVLVALGAAWTPGEARSLGASAVSVAGTDAVISPGGPVLTAEEAAKLDPWLRFALAQSATRPGPAQEQAVGASVTQRWGEMLAARETTVGRLRDLHAGAPVGPVRAGTRGQLAITASSPVSLVPAVITPDTWLRLVVVTSDPAALEEAGAIVRAYSGGVAAILVRADDLAAIAQPLSVTWIGGPTFVQPANDLGRDDAGVPEAARQFGADGAGATVVIIDSGVDWTHASFVDSAGHTRIRALLDLSVPGDIDADGVLDGAGPGGGTLYTAADIDRALGKLAAGVSHQHSWPSGPAPVPDKGVLKAQVTVPKVQSTTVETLHVRLRLGHGAMGDISLRLVAPDGRAVVLLDDAKGGTEMLSAAYEVRGLEGLSSAGTWTLEVADDVEGSYGRLYDWTLMVNMPVLHQDLVGHGTHVAGTAAGDDAAVGATEPGPLAGAAPAADLVVAAVSRDFGDSITIDDLMAGTAWADSYARGIGQPYVANMSLGGYAGARDGSAPLDLFVDGLFGPGQGGGALVAAIGNDGDYEVHAGGEFGPDDDHIALDVADGSYIELIEAWFEGPSTTEIGLRLPGGLECLSTDPSGGDVREDCDRLALRPGESRMVVMVSPSGEGAAIGELAWAERDAADGLYQVLFLLLAFDDSLMAGDYHIVFHRAAGPWNAWSYASEAFGDAGDNHMTLGSPATAHSAIAVGSHTTRVAWVDGSGERHFEEGHVNAVSTFSSRGPTSDGRVKPDLTAPGEYIVSARSAASWWPDMYVISETEVIARGTSMAAPFVTGVAALVMSQPGRGDLDADELRDVLRQGARTDDYTGLIPNPDSGFGKLDAVKALDLVSGPKPTVEPTSTATTPPTATPTPTPVATSELPGPDPDVVVPSCFLYMPVAGR